MPEFWRGIRGITRISYIIPPSGLKSSPSSFDSQTLNVKNVTWQYKSILFIRPYINRFKIKRNWFYLIVYYI